MSAPEKLHFANRPGTSVLCTPILALSFLILGILQYYVDTYGYVSYGIGAVAICFIFQWTSFASWYVACSALNDDWLERDDGFKTRQEIRSSLLTSLSCTG